MEAHWKVFAYSLTLASLTVMTSLVGREQISDESDEFISLNSDE